MILGLGIDIVDIRRLAEELPTRLAQFTAAEIALCEARASRLAAYAKRFAIKEAVMKALGSNDALGGVEIAEIEVVSSKSGRPTVKLHGGALTQLGAITPAGFAAEITVTASDDYPNAAAAAVIWVRPHGT